MEKGWECVLGIKKLKKKKKIRKGVGLWGPNRFVLNQNGDP